VKDDDWQLCLSKEHADHQYWFHKRSGTQFWRKRTPFDNGEKVAIIVPFRDLQAEQKRTEQLNRFHPEMTKFLRKADVPFKIFIIEQSNDSRKFNRGKLLNVGFHIAKSEGYNIFVLHDVDLIPSDGLLPYYVSVPSSPVHVARVWNRYNGNENYFGGIVTFSTEQYEAINGYPNNYWGWGGEDDELYKRTRKCKFSIGSPDSSEGSIYDMEEMDLTTKLNYLRENQLLKCNNKKELLDEHESTWQTNGLNAFCSPEQQFYLEEVQFLSDFCVKITVELTLNNGHWSDLRCGINDQQYDETTAAPKYKKRKI
jgi:hypothetical protein